jgi:hypothetical protein
MNDKEDVYLDEGVVGWINKTARKEYWRVSRWYDLADLIQDGYVCYYNCRNRYTLTSPTKPGHQALNVFGVDGRPNKDQRKHFMALVKVSFYNHIMTLSSRFAANTETPECDLATADGPADIESLAAAVPEEMSVMTALLNAPTEIGEAIAKLLNDGVEGGSYLRSRLRRRDGRVTKARRALRETTSERLARVLGDPTMAERVRNYITGDDDWEVALERKLALVFSHDK